jgi:hypothetical protein
MKKTAAKKPLIGVRLEEDLLKAVEKLAASEEWSISHTSRRLIRLAVNVLLSVSEEDRPKILRMVQGQENISALLKGQNISPSAKRSKPVK